MHYFSTTCQSGHPKDRPKTQSILWKDIVRGSYIIVVLEEQQIKKGNEKTSGSGVIPRHQHLGFCVLSDSSGSTLRQWLPVTAQSRHQLPLCNATQLTKHHEINATTKTCLTTAIDKSALSRHVKCRYYWVVTPCSLLDTNVSEKTVPPFSWYKNSSALQIDGNFRCKRAKNSTWTALLYEDFKLWPCERGLARTSLPLKQGFVTSRHENPVFISSRRNTNFKGICPKIRIFGSATWGIWCMNDCRSNRYDFAYLLHYAREFYRNAVHAMFQFRFGVRLPEVPCYGLWTWRTWHQVKHMNHDINGAIAFSVGKWCSGQQDSTVLLNIQLKHCPYMQDVVTDDTWFEARSEICLADRYANLHLAKLILNSGVLMKRTTHCIRNSGTPGRVRTSRLLLMTKFALRGDSAYTLAKGCDCIAARTPWKQKHHLQLSATSTEDRWLMVWYGKLSWS